MMILLFIIPMTTRVFEGATGGPGAGSFICPFSAGFQQRKVMPPPPFFFFFFFLLCVLYFTSYVRIGNRYKSRNARKVDKWKDLPLIFSLPK